MAWDRVTRVHVLRAIEEYDRLGPEQFFSAHGFAPTTTYELAWKNAGTRRKQSWAQLISLQLVSGLAPDFEGGKTGAVRVLRQLGFVVEEKRRPAK